MRYDSDGGFDPTIDLILELIFGVWTVEHSSEEDS